MPPFCRDTPGYVSCFSLGAAQIYAGEDFLSLAARDTEASRHNGGPIEGLPKTHWWFKGGLNCPP